MAGDGGAVLDVDQCRQRTAGQTGRIAIDGGRRFMAPEQAWPVPRSPARVVPFRSEHWVEPTPGHRFLVRPVRPADDAALRRLLESSSPEDIRFRFLMSLRLFSDRIVKPLTRLANVHRLGLVAAAVDGAPGSIVGHAILAPDGGGEAEFALLVLDGYRQFGLGRHLLECLVEHARALGLRRIYGIVLAENHRMRELAREMTFRERRDPDEPTCVREVLELAPAQGGSGLS
jgi:acetyltransferase